jgi:hyaluronoglucosaminidase
VVEASFRVRGVVEGFYGPPWSHDARLEMIDFIGARGMNAYAYAPKDDAKHRAAWREPYDADETRRFAELAARAKDAGVRFGFAVSPGLDITYESDADRATLVEKLLALAEHGVTWFLLLLDDIPMQPGLAPRHADLACGVLGALRAATPEATLTVCPTEYVGMQSSPYLAALAAGLPRDVDVMWTGPTVCSPTITASQARERAAALGGRPPLVWDNYPVNDGTMSSALHIGPYRGRDPELAGVIAGVLCNPMIQPLASKLALVTAAAFLSHPDGYDADAAVPAAVAATDATRVDPLATLVAACGDSALSEPADLEFTRLVDRIEACIDGPDWAEPVRCAADELRRARELAAAFPPDGDALAVELAPWAAAARVEANAGLAALKLLQQIRPVGQVEGLRGHAAAPDAERAMEHAFFLLYSWSGARANDRTVFGPRFAIYPAVVQLSGGRPGLDVGGALRSDENGIDRLCRLALSAYDTWSSTPDAPIEVFVDYEVRVCAGDGTFDAGGTVTLVRAGRFATRVDQSPPFRDRRLA